MLKILISIEGSVGSGKTTVIDRLRSAPELDGAIFIEEPLGRQLELLERYYHNPHYEASLLQTSMLLRRGNVHFLAMRETGLYIVERTIETDKNIFMQANYNMGHLNDVYRKDYLEMYDNLSGMVKMPHRYIYLRGSEDLLLRNIKTRNRPGEQRINKYYLHTLEELYDKWLLNNTRAYVINLTPDTTRESVYETVLSHIINCMAYA